MRHVMNNVINMVIMHTCIQIARTLLWKLSRRHQSRQLNLLLTTDEWLTSLKCGRWMTANSKHLDNLGIYIKTLRGGRSDANNLHIVHKLMRRDWVISAHISTCSCHICVTRNVHQHLLCNTQTTSVSGRERTATTQRQYATLVP